MPFTLLGSDHVSEQLDWTVTVRMRAELPPPVPPGVRLPGPGGGDGRPAREGGREGPVHERVRRDAADRAVCRPGRSRTRW